MEESTGLSAGAFFFYIDSRSMPLILTQRGGNFRGMLEL
jgi:hypothetical protein